jgi:hypothetical protein
LLGFIEKKEYFEKSPASGPLITKAPKPKLEPSLKTTQNKSITKKGSMPNIKLSHEISFSNFFISSFWNMTSDQGLT